MPIQALKKIPKPKPLKRIHYNSKPYAEIEFDFCTVKIRRDLLKRNVKILDLLDGVEVVKK